MSDSEIYKSGRAQQQETEMARNKNNNK